MGLRQKRNKFLIKIWNGLMMIYIVPTIKGNFKIKISIMCSEYLEPVEKYIDFEVV